jgi:23S rRNA U2552 (ribose-2'-O)-methylase RlmE/FtsJ
MKTLKEIFARIGNHSGVDIGCNDKDGIHTYVDTYDKLFAPFQKGCSFMEIGLAMGDSIDLFDEYFDNSEIVGVDISVVFTPKKYKNDVAIIEADATKANFLKTIEFKTFDIIIDDGSHMTQDQLDTFDLLKGKMNKGGIYVIEDLLALDIERHRYMRMHKNVEIIDMRANGRFDNALVIIRF